MKILDVNSPEMGKLVDGFCDKFDAITRSTDNNRNEQTAMLAAMSRTFGSTMAVLGEANGARLLAAAMQEAARVRKLL